MPGFNNEDYHPLLSAFVERLLDERDKQYTKEFQNLKENFNSAIAAMDKATNAAFAASEKAIAKAEQAQQLDNIRTNEFRASLDDANKIQLPRLEAAGLFAAMDSRMNNMIEVRDSKIKSLHDAVEKTTESLSKDMAALRESVGKEIASLRESRSVVSGRDYQQHESRDQKNWTVGTLIALVIGLMGLLMSLAALVSRVGGNSSVSAH